MKKTCNNCKALDFGVSSVYCSLGYNIKPKTYQSVVVGGIPQEDCPKPTAFKSYSHLIKLQKYCEVKE